MKVGPFFRGLAAIIVAVLYNSLLTFPHLFLVAFLHGVQLVTSATAFRTAVTRWMTWHGDRLFRILVWILGIRVELSLPAKDICTVPGPLIVIANHQSTMDIPLVYYVMETLGRPHLRWVIKRTLLWTPFGWFGWLTNCGFVRRKGQDPVGDRLEIRRCAVLARVDHAAIVIYPEGSRVTKPGPGYLHLKAPKVDGFILAREWMGSPGVLSITLRWTHDAVQGRGRTWLDAFDFVGKRLSIWVDYIPPETIAQDPEWLVHHWEAKDRFLQVAS